MEMRPLSEIYDAYIDILLEGYIFYVPKKVFSSFLLEQFEGKIDDDYFDNAHLIVKGDFGKGGLRELQRLQFEKVTKLEGIYFDLVQLEQDLSQKQFEKLIHKYIDYVEFLASLAKWFAEHLGTYFEIEEDMEAYGLFANQWNHFSMHFLELYRAFGESYKYQITAFYSVEEFIGKYLPDFVGRFEKFSRKFPFDYEEEDFIETTPIVKPTPKKQKKKKQKRVLITDEQADLFLLETVFNVKF